jgi:MFS family permease
VTHVTARVLRSLHSKKFELWDSPVDASPQRFVNPWIVTLSVMLATFMEVLDTTVVNVSIQHIAGNLASTNADGTWVVTSYLVSNAIVSPISGWLANHMGRKRLLLTCVAGFTLTSLGCGLATSLTQLIIFGVLQGLTGGPGDSAGNFSQGTAWTCHGGVWRRHSVGADSRAYFGRMDYR